jgi:hypothetical protein
MKTLKWLVLLLLTMLFLGVCGQHLPIKITINKFEYRINGSYDLTIKNNDSLTYGIMIGLEKYNKFGIWEEITENIYSTKLELDGKADDDLYFLLLPYQSLDINEPFKGIYIPIALKQNSPSKEMGCYRLSATTDNDPSIVLTGQFRFSVKCIYGDGATEYMIFKTQYFNIE